MLGRTRLADLVDVRAVESTFQSLVATFEKQSEEIVYLKNYVSRLELKMKEYEAPICKIQSAQTILEGRIRLLEEATNLPNVKNASIGSIVTANYKEIVHLREKMKNRIGQDAVAIACNDLEARLSNAIDTLRKESVSLKVISSLHMDQDALHDRISTISVRLDSKLDKADWSRMDAVSSKLHAFIPRCDGIESMLTKMNDAVKDNSNTCEHRSQLATNQFLQLQENMEGINSDLSRTKAEWNATQLSTDAFLQRCKRNIKLCHESMLVQKKHCSESIFSIRSALDDAKHQVSLLSSNVASELEKKLNAKEWQSIIPGHVTREFETKASRVDVDALTAQLLRVDEWTARSESHLQLCTRFINWFFDRGEAYEQNLHVVETQLKKLARFPPPRDPYDNTFVRLE